MLNHITGPIMAITIAVICVGFSIYFCHTAVRRLVFRLKQRSIITLVEMRQSKLTSYISLAVIAVVVVIVIAQIFNGPEISVLYYQYSLNRVFATILLSAITLLGVSVALVVGVALINLCAVMDKGLANAGRFYDWYNLHDYLMDDKNRLTVSTQKLTVLTFKGTLPPAKVREEDVPKLEFILNKNKNKFH